MARALVIASHPDDELLGCGSTVEKLTRDGWSVEAFILWPGRGYKDDNAMDRYPLIDTVKLIEKRISLIGPERVYTHSACDLNVDHNITHRAVLTATRPFISSVKEIYCFETPSSTECNFSDTFRPNVFEEITEEQLSKKIDLLYSKYCEEMRLFPHPRSQEYLRASAIRWGGVAGVELAEAFELVRLIR